MANKRPPLEIGELTQNLKQSTGKGTDAFFPSPPPSQEVQKNTPRPNEAIVTRSKESQPVQEFPNKSDNKRISASSDVMTSLLHDVNYREWRDIIENTETHNSSLRLTTEEAEDVEDLIKELKRKLKIKTSLNEIARLGLLYILHDFKKNRENSLVYKVKKS
jgi:hypothetical protein